MYRVTEGYCLTPPAHCSDPDGGPGAAQRKTGQKRHGAAAFRASSEDIRRAPIFVGGLPANGLSTTLVKSLQGLPPT